MNVRQRSLPPAETETAGGDNVQIDIINEDEKDGNVVEILPREKCADPAGSGKCRSGIGDLCRELHPNRI